MKKIFRSLFFATALLSCCKVFSQNLEIPRFTENYIKSEVVKHLAYTVSYNSDYLIPNWVAYELKDKELKAEVSRGSRKFQPDPDLKGRQAEDSDYRGSGYDRGHMIPAADNKWSEKAMAESFYFTNCCPQNHNLNAGDWENLEEKVRTLASRFDEVYVCCGPIIGANSQGTIGRNEVVVPDAFFKVLLISTPLGWQGIGYVFPNKAGKKKLITYATTIDEVEELTGLDFFYQLPDDEEKKVENHTDFIFWSL